MSWGMVAGAAVSVGGSMLSGGSGSAPKIKMYDTASDIGNVDYIKRGGGDREINLSLSGEQQGIYDTTQGLARGLLQGGAGAPTYQNAMYQGGQALPGAFQDAMANRPSYQPYSDYLSQMGRGVANPYLNMSQAGMFGGNQMMAGLLSGRAPGLGNAQEMYRYGRDRLNNDYNSVYQDRLGLLREQAAPFEERAQNSFMNKLFSMGQLGADSTAGNRSTEAFARGLGQADTTRQLDAMNLSEALYGRDLAAGQNLMGQGTQGIMQAYGQGVNNISNLYGIAGTGAQGYGNTMGNMFDARTAYEALTNERAQRRMRNASEMFGFGQQGMYDAYAQANNLQNMGFGIYDQLQQQADLSSTAAGVGASNSAIPGSQWQQAAGGLLSGIGGGMMANPTGTSTTLRGMFAPALGGTVNTQGIGLSSGQLNSVGGLLDGLRLGG